MTLKKALDLFKKGAMNAADETAHRVFIWSVIIAIVAVALISQLILDQHVAESTKHVQQSEVIETSQ